MNEKPYDELTTSELVADAREFARSRSYAGAGDRQLIEELASRLAKVETAMFGLKKGDCWCGMGIGNPMITNHTPSCVVAQGVTS